MILIFNSPSMVKHFLTQVNTNLKTIAKVATKSGKSSTIILTISSSRILKQPKKIKLVTK